MQPDLFLDAIRCAYCDRMTYNPFTVKRHTNGVDLEIKFCCERCANEYYLDKLRRAGQ